MAVDSLPDIQKVAGGFDGLPLRVVGRRAVGSVIPRHRAVVGEIHASALEREVARVCSHRLVVRGADIAGPFHRLRAL